MPNRMPRKSNGHLAAVCLAASVLAACSSQQGGNCVQTVGSHAAREVILGGFVELDNKIRCSMSLRLLSRSEGSYLARLSTANHCTELLGLIPEKATLSVYGSINGGEPGYFQKVAFVPEFRHALDGIRKKAKDLGSRYEDFADWAIEVPRSVRFLHRRQTAENMQRDEQTLVRFFNGCPYEAPGSSLNEYLCTTVPDLLLEYIQIPTAGLHAGLSTLFDNLLPQHRTLTQAEDALNEKGGDSLAARAVRLHHTVLERWDLERTRSLSLLMNVGETCKLIQENIASEDDLNTLLSDTPNRKPTCAMEIGCDPVDTFGALHDQSRRVWQLCQNPADEKLKALETLARQFPLLSGRTPAELYDRLSLPASEDGESGFTQIYDRVVQLHGNADKLWDAMIPSFVPSLQNFAFAANAPLPVSSNETNLLAQSGSLHFQFHSIKALLRGDAEAKAFLADPASQGPAFVVPKNGAGFLVDFKRGASGSIIAFHGDGISLPIAALTALSDEYTSGGASVIPLPQDPGTATVASRYPDEAKSPQAGQPDTATRPAPDDLSPDMSSASDRPTDVEDSRVEARADSGVDTGSRYGTRASLPPDLAKAEGIPSDSKEGKCL